jgi:hypothetical protein
MTSKVRRLVTKEIIRGEHVEQQPGLSSTPTSVMYKCVYLSHSSHPVRHSSLYAAYSSSLANSARPAFELR